MNNHQFHIANLSHWPIISSISLFSTMTGLIMWMYKTNKKIITISIISLALSSAQWWRDMVRESTFQGMHKKKSL